MAIIISELFFMDVSERTLAVKWDGLKDPCGKPVNYITTRPSAPRPTVHVINRLNSK